jgi:hypothetical protein
MEEVDLKAIWKSDVKSFHLGSFEFHRNSTNASGSNVEVFFCDIGVDDHFSHGWSVEVQTDGVRVWSYKEEGYVYPFPHETESAELSGICKHYENLAEAHKQ